MSQAALERIESAITAEATLALRDEAIARAQAACDALAKITVTNEDEAARVSDKVAVVKDGLKIARSKLDGVLRPIKAAEAAARGVFRPIQDALAEAEQGGKNALVAWTRERQRREREERERLERLAAEAAKKQRAGDAQAPPMELPPPAIPEPIRGARSTTYETSVVCCEVVDPHAVVGYDPSLMKLDEARAKALFRGMEQGAAGVAHPRGGVVLFGVRFWREQRVGVR